MFSGLLGKLVLTALVAFLVWRGLQLWKGMQQRLAKAEAERDRQSRAPKSLDLAPCRLCGTYVPGGLACASREACRYRRA